MQDQRGKPMGKEFVVDSLEDMCALMCDNNTEGLEGSEMTPKRKKNINFWITIPEGTTNGDVLKTVFPNVDTNFSNVFDMNLWWNTPYKKESED